MSRRWRKRDAGIRYQHLGGVLAPQALEEIVANLTQINKALVHRTMRSKLESRESRSQAGSRSSSSLIHSDMKKWDQVAKDANIVPNEPPDPVSSPPARPLS